MENNPKTEKNMENIPNIVFVTFLYIPAVLVQYRMAFTERRDAENAECRRGILYKKPLRSFACLGDLCVKI